MSQRQRTIDALTREAGFYVEAGRFDSARLVNVELRALGADPVAVPKTVEKRTASSAQAATRKKRS